MTGRNSSRVYSNGCAYDRMVELIAEAEHLAHVEERCPGAPVCGDCLDEQQEIEDELQNKPSART